MHVCYVQKCLAHNNQISQVEKRMPLNDTTKSLLKKNYGNLPGPGDYTYDIAADVSSILTKYAIKMPGAICVCVAESEWIYIGMSPSLQKQALDSKNGVNHIPQIIQLLKNGLKTNKVWICMEVEQQIAKNYWNPGCAEKKVISAIRKFGDRILEISIIQHPLDTDTNLLSFYQAVGDKYGAYIIPCDSCLQVAKAFA